MCSSNIDTSLGGGYSFSNSLVSQKIPNFLEIINHMDMMSVISCIVFYHARNVKTLGHILHSPLLLCDQEEWVGLIFCTVAHTCLLCL